MNERERERERWLEKWRMERGEGLEVIHCMEHINMMMHRSVEIDLLFSSY